MKESYYFSHDYSARNDPKLQAVLMTHGAAGIGAFWCIIEQMYEQGGTLPMVASKSIAFALHMDCKTIESIVTDFELFHNNGEVFWSESVKARLDKRHEMVEKRRDAARKKWAKLKGETTDQGAPADASAMQVHTENDASAMQLKEIKEKERKGKETKLNESITLTLDNINIKGGKTKNAQRFCPPSVEDVAAYVEEKHYTFDPAAFVAFYDSKGWLIGKNKMKNWRAACVTWEKREREDGRARRKGTISKTANDEWTQ